MTRPLISLALSAGLIAFGLPRAADAQSSPKGELSFGYQFLDSVQSVGDGSYPVGWYVDVAGNVTPSVTAVAEFGGNYKSIFAGVPSGGVVANGDVDMRVHQFLGGVRLSSRASQTVVPFGQLLIGAFHSAVTSSATTATIDGQVFHASGSGSETNVAFQAGGGTGIFLTKTIGIRFGVDYLCVYRVGKCANMIRLGAGLDLGF